MFKAMGSLEIAKRLLPKMLVAPAIAVILSGLTDAGLAGVSVMLAFCVGVLFGGLGRTTAPSS